MYSNNKQQQQRNSTVIIVHKTNRTELSYNNNLNFVNIVIYSYAAASRCNVTVIDG